MSSPAPWRPAVKSQKPYQYAWNGARTPDQRPSSFNSSSLGAPSQSSTVSDTPCCQSPSTPCSSMRKGNMSETIVIDDDDGFMDVALAFDESRTETPTKSVAVDRPIGPSSARNPQKFPAASKASSQTEITICGTKVTFPFKPYPSQIALMDKVLKCLSTGQNGLLESPTGSGKSLSLLCSSLAWQTAQFAERNRRNQEAMEAMAASAEPGSVRQHRGRQHRAGPSISLVPQPSIKRELEASSSSAVDEYVGDTSQTANSAKRKFVVKKKVKKNPAVVYENEDEDDFVELPSTASRLIGKVPLPEQEGEMEDWDVAPDIDMPDAEKKDEIPKIYYCTRTHKQIAQLIRELRRTKYKNIKMTILGSREQYCVHPTVSRLPNKNENCTKLLEKKNPVMDAGVELDDDDFTGRGCSFFTAGKNLDHESLRRNAILPVFDIEDLVEAGKRHQFCPYFGSRELSKASQLIFCPYNYLVDSKIRHSMQISLNNIIVIFDEGHNMEDSARESASYSLKENVLKDGIEDIGTVMGVIGHVPLQSILQACQGVLIRLSGWISMTGQNIQADMYGGHRDYKGDEMMRILRDLGLGPVEFSEFVRNVEIISTDKKAVENENDDYGQGPVFGEDGELLDESGQSRNKKKISAGTLMVLESIGIVLDYLYRDKARHAADYHIVLMKERNTTPFGMTQNQNGFRRRRGLADADPWRYTLHFWCMNPAVAFEDFKECRSVLLTSGTLSPLRTFQSELGINFGIQFEANHVIDMKQVWAGAIGFGPKNEVLKGVYDNVQKLEYQDGVGGTILKVCEVVPKGILCFFSSYQVLNTLLTRWKNTGLLDAIRVKKRILEEPRNMTQKSDFEYVMRDFYEAIRGENLEFDSQDGALMLAVCRGKISEGLDFADDNARAVITVGIPFPAWKDPQVQMKREFNDNLRRNGQEVLSGSDWYDIQAYRAVNQALGRCIRHKHDWGALILLDERFAAFSSTNKHVAGLSKWLRKEVKPYNNFNIAMRNLRMFFEAQQKRTADLPKTVDLTVCDDNFLTDDEEPPNV